ncbi:hypothetical protein ACQP2K_11180 [Microbispora siamensis]
MIDVVGGPLLVEAYDRLAEGGTLVAVGHVTGEPETFPFGALFGDKGHVLGRRLHGKAVLDLG